MINDERDNHSFYSDKALKAWRKKTREMETQERKGYKTPALRDPSRQITEETEEQLI